MGGPAREASLADITHASGSCSGLVGSALYGRLHASSARQD